MKKILLCLLIVFYPVIIFAKPNWKIPLEAGHQYKITVGYNGLAYDNTIDTYHTNEHNGYFH